MTRDEAIYLLKQIYTGNPNDKVALHMAIEALEKAAPIPNGNLINFGDIGSPTIKPLERKRGKWIYKPMKGQFCSVCDVQSVWKYNYCPNCGADMRGEKDVD